MPEGNLQDTPPAVVTLTTPTQPQAVNVDIEAISKLAADKAEAKMEAVFKSMLTQQGLDPATAAAMTAEWKSKQSTPEMELKQRDEIIATLQAEKLAEQQKNIAILKGVPIADEAQVDKVTACLTLAKSYVSETVTYEQALDKALAIVSFTQAETKQSGFVPTAGQSGGGATTAKDKILEDARKAMGIK